MFGQGITRMNPAKVFCVAWLGSLALCCWATVGRAQQETALRAEQLVQQLGADRFEQREQAAAELMQLGPVALPATRQGLKNPDVEIRRRCRVILRLLERRWLREQIHRFLTNPDESDLEQLPGWKHFFEVMGKNRKAAFSLYRQVARDQQSLLLSWNDPRELQRLLERNIQAVYLQSRIPVGGQVPSPAASTVAGLFVASLHPQVKLNPQTLYALQTISYRGRFRSQVLAEPQATPLRHMLTQWLKRYQHEMDPNRLLSWAVSFQLPGALEPAVQVVKNGGPNQHVLVQAMLVLARFGNRQHADLLKRHMKNEQVVYQLRRRANDVLRVEVRDVALAVTIHLYGQDPKRFGFAELQPNPQLVYQPTSLGFSNPTARNLAFSRWKEFLETGKL